MGLIWVEMGLNESNIGPTVLWEDQYFSRDLEFLDKLIISSLDFDFFVFFIFILIELT